MPQLVHIAQVLQTLHKSCTVGMHQVPSFNSMAQACHTCVTHLSLLAHDLAMSRTDDDLQHADNDQSQMQVQEADLHRVAVATGAQVQTTVNNLNPRVLGTCTSFEEKQVFSLAKKCTVYWGAHRKHAQQPSMRKHEMVCMTARRRCCSPLSICFNVNIRIFQVCTPMSTYISSSSALQCQHTSLPDAKLMQL